MKNKVIIISISVVVGLSMGYFLFKGDVHEHEAHATENAGTQIWTCSMHPQIRATEPGDCPICGMELIPLDENKQSNPLVFEMTEDAMRIANIQTTVIGGADGAVSGNVLSGKIVTDETVASSIVSHIPGRVEKLYVSFTGDRIVTGQKIASIYSPDLITAQNELLGAYKMRDQSPELLESAKNKLRYWKISNQEINEIIKSGHVRELFDIRADHSGIVQKKNINVGDYIQKGAVLFALQNLDQLWAVFDVYEEGLQHVKEGQSLTFTTTALPNETFTGKISFIDPFIDPATRTASVRVKIRNTGNRLKPEMFIMGQLERGNDKTLNSTLVVPKTAVLWTGERSVVYVKQPNVKAPSFEFREVHLGAKIGDGYEVLQGLSSGDEVVTNGAFVIDASAQLNNQTSMMNKRLLEKSKYDVSDFKDFKEKAPEAFKDQLGQLLTAYYQIKDALVSDDLKKAISKTEKVSSALKAVDMSQVNGDAHMYWMKLSARIETATNHMSESGDLLTARTIFEELSEAMIAALKSFGTNQKTSYVQFCPMAFDNKGGYWLSNSTDIRNPLFGSEMLQCGSIEDTLNK